MTTAYDLPPPPRFRPLRALARTRRLLRDKEDTAQVFAVADALAGASRHRAFRRLAGTACGQRYLAGAAPLLSRLTDRAALRALPAASLGRAYLDFMEREGLTPEGVLAVSNRDGIKDTPPDRYVAFKRFYELIDITHDFFHVLTGFGRDALGELAVLAFTRQQIHNWGFTAIIVFGRLKFGREAPTVPFGRVLREARAMGRRSAWLLAVDFASLLDRPLAEVRRELSIEPSPTYAAIDSTVLRSLGKREDERAAAPA